MENEICKNCKKEIAKANIILHTAHCTVYTSLCPKCDEPVLKSKLEEHKKTCNPEPPKQTCTNCKKEITTNFILHTAHCTRFLSLCPICNQSIPNSQFQDHQKICNKKTMRKQLRNENLQTPTVGETSKPSTGIAKKLSFCNEKLQTPTVGETSKPSTGKAKRLSFCRYCFLDLPEEGLKEHEDYCGSRTDICEGCGKRVVMKDFDMHVSTECTRNENVESKDPQPSTSRTNSRPNPKNPKPKKGQANKKKKSKEGKRKSDR